MRRARTQRVGLTLVLGAALWTTSAGCTHNYYYGAVPAGCAPSTTLTPSSVSSNTVCEVPTHVVGGATTVVSSPYVLSTPVLTGPRPPRIVLSEPNVNTRPSWRRGDPDSGSGLATTRVEGALDDSTITK